MSFFLYIFLFFWSVGRTRFCMCCAERELERDSIFFPSVVLFWLFSSLSIIWVWHRYGYIWRRKAGTHSDGLGFACALLLCLFYLFFFFFWSRKHNTTRTTYLPTCYVFSCGYAWRYCKSLGVYVHYHIPYTYIYRHWHWYRQEEGKKKGWKERSVEEK